MPDPPPATAGAAADARRVDRTEGSSLEVVPAAAGAGWPAVAPAGLVEMIGDAFVAFDRDLNYTYVNERAGALFGRRPADLVGRNYWQEYPEARETPFARAYEEALRTGRPVHFENYYEPWDRWFENRVYPSPAGLAVFFTEITDRKRAEAAVARERDFSDALLDSLPGVFYLYDDSLRFLRWNKNFELVTGYGATEIAGMSPLDFFAADEKRLIAERIAAVFAEGSAHAEAELLTKAGVRLAYYFTGVRLEIGDRRCLIGVGIDVTQARQAAEEVRRLNIELERRVADRTAQLVAANKELEAFSYSVSHDLRAPLRAVSGFAEIIARRHRARLDEEGQHYVDNIVLAAERMGHLIDALLRYSRLGHRAMKTEEVPLAEVFAPLVTTFSARLQADGGTLQIAPELPRVLGDRHLLGQVFSNLLENAVTYRSPGVPPLIRVRCERSGGDAVVCVVDNGIGIAPEYHEKIFRMFQRLHSEDAYPGTGIGLPTVKRALDLLGGEISVESAPGQGSTFRVRLPAAADPVAGQTR